MLMETDLIPAELAATVDRLENWGRWAVERDKRGRAASAEGRHRARRGNNESEEDALASARRGSRPAIDALDASLVDVCIAPIKIGPRISRILKLKFFQRVEDEAIFCRMAAISRSRYQDEVRRALIVARNVLDRRMG